MCGITGFWSSRPDTLEATVQAMTGALEHRGPDDAGTFVEADVCLALGHRRLAILDLSPEGRQPMASPSGRFVMVFNGEVYNFDELRQDLTGVRWRGHSDTEVMLAAIDAWGLEGAVGRFNGMFAFALWDRKERHLYLVRDRLGIKPLYYGRVGSAFLFASELKALRQHPAFRGELCHEAVGLFLRYSYIPAPLSIYQDIYKLMPGTILKLTHPAGTPQVASYWSAHRAAYEGAQHPFEGSEEEALEQLEARLLTAVKRRMVADVPLGAFLSGGIDSSTVTALMQAQSTQRVKTFTIGFREGGFDEAGHARAVAEVLNTDHTELYVTADDALALVPRMAELYDEPFADASQIPTFLISHLARRSVTVSLSGDGGDELFGGYTRYFKSLKLWGRLERLPRALRLGSGRVARAVPEGVWERGLSHLHHALPANVGGGGAFAFQRYLPLAAKYLSLRDGNALYQQALTQWDVERTLSRKHSHKQTSSYAEPAGWTAFPEYMHRMMYWDLVTYLPDDILVKLDRASMGVGLEARVPLLDHQVVELAWRFPLAFNIDALQGNVQGKSLLRKLLYRYVPQPLVDRPKMGFGMPVGAWLRGPLREWSEELLEPARLGREGLLEPAIVTRRWRDHLTGKIDWEGPLWNVLMLQAWLEAHSQAQP